MTAPYRNYSAPDPAITEWAYEAARSTIWARRISRVCLGLSVAALALGVVAAGMTFWMYVGDDAAFGMNDGWKVGASQGASALVNALLPAGLLAGAAAFLRLQAVRFETDLYDRDDDDDAESGPAPEQ